jgi:DNA-binding NarL/FixJ family response regulator
MRIAVADSVGIFRDGVCNVLSSEHDFDVYSAESVDHLLAVAVDTATDIALMDYDLQPGGALAALPQLSELGVRSIVWAFNPTSDDVLAAVVGGADGFLSKEVTPHGLVRSIRAVFHGEIAIPRSLATQMAEALRSKESNLRDRERAARLSRREVEVLRLVAEGARNREIADRLVISEFTVKRHVQNILHKLEMPSRRAAAHFYLSVGNVLERAQVTLPA